MFYTWSSNPVHAYFIEPVFQHRCLNLSAFSTKELYEFIDHKNISTTLFIYRALNTTIHFFQDMPYREATKQQELYIHFSRGEEIIEGLG